jgi:replicative DNA helicase
MIVGHFYML